MSPLKYETYNLGHDWPGKIHDFSKVRNLFLEHSDTGWIFWQSDDEEPSRLLLKYIEGLNPTYPYYGIRRINLRNGRYIQAENPDFSPHLVSDKVRYVGKLHEHVEPRRPCGYIDYPIIHNQANGDSYNSGWKATFAYRPVLAFKRSLDIMKGR